MATILIVDDRPLNREYLVTLLGYKGHRLLEAADGVEALEIVRNESPDLVIADILMPTMDGYEFVRQLRASPDIAATKVIFHSAHFLEREARSLAQSCGVTHILTKPSPPDVVLKVVEAALAMAPQTAEPASFEEFDREHLRLLTDKLSQKTEELRATNLRLTALMELNEQLATERDPFQLAQRYCNEAREIIGAKYSAVGILSDDGRTLDHLYASGLNIETARRIIVAPTYAAALSRVVSERHSVRLRGLAEQPEELGALGSFPIRSALGGPLASSARVYGWLALLDKLGADEFDDEDERLTVTFTSQLAVAYDNARLYAEARDHCAALETEASHRKRAEEAQLRLAAILEATPDFVATFDQQGERALYINEAGRRMIGAESADPATMKISNFMPAWAYELVLSEGIPTAIRKGAWSGETALRDRHGRGIPVSLVILAHKTSSGSVEYLSTVARDISDRKRAEESLREAEEKYRSIFENAVEGIFQSTLSGDFITANPAMARILGYESPLELLESTRDKERQLHVDPVRRTEMMRLLELDGKLEGVEISLFRKDGSKLLVSESARAIRGVNGRVLYYQGIIEDISERKDLEHQLLQAQKMEAVGRLAGGVAHDFNNLLTAIIGYGQLSLANVAVGDPTHTNIQEIIAAGERAASLTRQLLTFSRKQVLQPAIVDLNRTISETRRMLQRLIGEDINIVNLTDPALGRVRADPGQIEQVILNLAINARDAMPDGGRLTIETHNDEVDEAYACAHPGVAPGPYVVLTVTDTGCGMDADVKSHIFEPFFTTKEAGKGTGLGLSTVYGIVKQSFGDLVVFSEPGMGTSFKIYLPRLVDSSVPEVRSPGDDSIPRGSETILLTEDEQIVREVASHVLRELGYTVLETSGGKEALVVARQYIGKIDLLLTDVVMPVMSGNELAGRIKAIRPDIKVLFCSGYTDDAIVHLGVLDHTIAFLQKPFAPSSLARKVREVLDE